MADNEKGLGRLCFVYEQLDDIEKEKLIKLGEGLLNAQKVVCDEKKIEEKKD